jgi:16S rRNA (cytosine967-C5)-methyltransferase
MAEREHHDRSGSRPQRRDDRAGGRPASGGGRGPRARSATAPSQRTRRAEPTRFAAYTLLRSVAEGAYANLELPTCCAAPPPGRPRCRVRHRAGLRHPAWQGLLRRRHREAAGPADRADRRPGPRRAAPRAHQLHGDACVRPTPPSTRPWACPRRGRGPAGRFRQRGPAPDEREDPEEWLGGSRPRGWGSGTRSRSPQRTPSGSSPRCGPPCSAMGERPPRRSTPNSKALLARRQRPAPRPLVARPGLSDVDELLSPAEARGGTLSRRRGAREWPPRGLAAGA